MTIAEWSEDLGSTMVRLCVIIVFQIDKLMIGSNCKNETDTTPVVFQLCAVTCDFR